MEGSTADKIIAAAIPLFAEKGFAAVTIRELADTANVNSSAISYYFAGKENLYKAVLEENFLPVGTLIGKVEALEHIGPLERLTTYVQNVSEIHRQRPFLIRFFYSEIANPTPCGREVIKKHMQQIYRFLYSALQEGVEKGVFAPDLNLNYTAVSLAGMVNSYFLSRMPLFKEFTSFPEQSGEEYTTQVLKMYIYGIVKREN